MGQRFQGHLRTLGIFTISQFLAGGCAKTSLNYGIVPEQNLFTGSNVTVNNKIDFLWVVDNSPSMSPIQNNLSNNFHSFIQKFESAGYDYKLAVTTSDAYLADARFKNKPALAAFSDGTTSHTGLPILLYNTPNLENLFVINATTGETGSGDERPFSSFHDALLAPANSSFRRDDAFLAIIIVSDEDDFSTSNPANSRCEYCGTDHDYGDSRLDTVQSYIDFLDGYTKVAGNSRRYNVNAMAVLDSSCQAAHSAAAPSTIVGQRYIQLAQATNGILGSICDVSFANALTQIQARIIELASRFTLSRLPKPETIQVSINNVTVPNAPENGWTYEALSNSITFHGSAIPAQGSKVSILFETLLPK